ncbi:MAG: DEAD/DEAH box helicase [Saprospiraceae bacterium]
MQTFNQLGLREEILQALSDLGFSTPTEIQLKSIPSLVTVTPDFIGLAQTGTGKTAAFGLPLIHHFDPKILSTYGLILAPTRELAQQIAKEFENFAKYIKGLRIEVFYGGTAITNNIRSLKKSVPHIIIATPGRLQDLIDRKAVKLDQLKFLILDEADEMLNMGFQEAVDNILQYTPEEKVVWLFSATMPKEIRRIIGEYMENPLEVHIQAESKTNVNIEHKYIYVSKSDKGAALKRVLDYLTDFYGVIFCKTKMDTQDLAEYLENEGYRAEPLHGDMSQSQRDAVMAKFRSKTTPILVATDVAARGIDVDSLTHVIHFSLPENPEYYTHRSGRTARAGKKGVSLAILTPLEINRLRFFEKTLGIEIKHIKVPLQSQMYNKKLEKWAAKVMDVETADLSDDIKEMAYQAFQFMPKEELIEKILALEFNKLYKKVEKDDLNIAPKTDFKKSKKDGDRGGRNDRFERNDSSSRFSSRENRASNPHMEPFFINIGKIDNIHPGILIDLLSSHTGLNKKQIGNIDIFRKHTILEIDKKVARRLEENKILKYKGRKVTIKRDTI